MNTTYQNNKLIRKTILSMFGGSLAATITAAIALMADTILAGVLFNKVAVAAVAVGTPIINIFQALTQTIINGASVKMSIAAGKGDTEEVHKSFAVAVFFSIVIGLVFILGCQFFAKPLVMAFGASPEIADMTMWYLRGSSGCIVFLTINLFLSKTLALYGMQKIIFRSAFVSILANIVFSLIVTKILPAHMAIMGLGIGTWMGGSLAITSSVLALRKHKISFRVRKEDITLERLSGFVRIGIPSSGNSLADGVVSGIVNNLIVNGFRDGVIALAVYTAVKSVTTFATAIVQAINLSVMPLFGIMYGARDKNGILRAYRESIRLAVMALGICAVTVSVASPVFAGAFDMKGVKDFNIGLIVCMFLYLPLTALVKITTQLFESMEKPGMGFVYSVIPDSIIYPLMLMLLMPVFGYNGIWMAYSLNPIPFLAGLYLVRSVKEKSFKLSPDRMLCIDKEIRDNVPKMDISINSDNRDVSFVSGQVHEFLQKEAVGDQIAYNTALCLEELATDFVEHTAEMDDAKADEEIMDIKLFSDEDKLRIIIRNKAEQYNPLDFKQDTEDFRKLGVKLALEMAKNLEYTYVYQMNIVTIDISK